MEKFKAAIKKALIPLTYLSCGLMAFSGAFLVYKGFLALLWLPIIAFTLSPLLFPLLMIPAGFFAGMMSLLTMHKPRLAMVMEWLSIFYLLAMLSGWAALVLGIAVPLAKTPLAWVGCIWAWASSLAPWLAFVSRDRANVMMAEFVYMMGGGGLLAMGVLLATLGQTVDLFWSVFSVMAVLTLLQMFYEHKFQRSKQFIV